MSPLSGTSQQTPSERFDVLIIGAGPSGSVAAALLVARGYRVLVLERETFPRFSIGESLLPQCMEFLSEAGMSDAVNSAGFQVKNGAMFQRRGQFSKFDFNDKFSPGPGETYQVPRADFDKLLADEAAHAGADIRYQHQITAVSLDQPEPTVQCQRPDGTQQTFTARFLLDASGFGRVLPRLLGLESPSDFPVRSSLFCHVEDRITSTAFDREKILISVHPRFQGVWYWLIPFSNGRSSLGVVIDPELLKNYEGQPHQKLQTLVGEDPILAEILKDAEWDTPVRNITGYSANVSELASNQYALLGNAGEFLDPVFSSGVTIAMKSASLASAALHRQLSGENVDWQTEYALPLQQGVDTFREFVTAWYDGRFQDIIFYQQQSPEIRAMISAILAGYAWDRNNPYVKSPGRRLNALWDYCRSTTKSA